MIEIFVLSVHSRPGGTFVQIYEPPSYK